MTEGEADIPNKLDAAIDRLEEVVHSRIEQPLRRLRNAIEHQRKHAKFDEESLTTQVEQLASRDRQDNRTHLFDLGREVDQLADWVMTRMPHTE